MRGPILRYIQIALMNVIGKHLLLKVRTRQKMQKQWCTSFLQSIV